MSKQPKALQLADALNAGAHHRPVLNQSAAELRRLHAMNGELLEALKNMLSYVENNLSNDYPTGIDINSRWFDAAYAAIAKAEGDQA